MYLTYSHLDEAGAVFYPCENPIMNARKLIN